MTSFNYFPPATYAPKRDNNYLSEEAEITQICRALGKEPQPWQRMVWEIGTQYQLNEHGQRLYKYKDVLITVPRQSGKTTLLHPLRLHRMIYNDAAHLFSTAQTQKHSSKRMLDMLNVVELSALAPIFKARRGKGDIGLILPENRSEISQFTPNAEATHGETAIYVDMDEIWYFSKELGDSIMGGVRPSQITLGARAQRWYTSTMGTLESEFMNDMVERGRKGNDPNLCYIEYSLADGLDPYDPKNWWTFHPALGNTIQEEDIHAETNLPEGEFLRAYCNRLTDAVATFMPLEDWDAMADPNQHIPPKESVTVGFEIAPGNDRSSVVAAWYDADGNPHAHVIYEAPGTKWLPRYLLELHESGFNHFAADDAGPVRRILDTFPDDFPLQKLTFQERRIADQTLITHMRDDQTLTHDGSKPLRHAVAAAQVRVNNGIELFDRDKSFSPIPALIALSVAAYAAAHAPENFSPLIIV